jgi:hypothetical protein
MLEPYLCTGNQRNGREPAQNRKKETKSRVFVPEEADMVFLGPSSPYLSHEGQMLRIMR